MVRVKGGGREGKKRVSNRQIPPRNALEYYLPF
jgi:hypothetical protein